MVKVGDTAPDFKLPDQDGNEFSFSSVLGKHNIVLYFYPKDFTPVCTAEACGFRDNFKNFENLNAIVIGISPDQSQSHSKFKNQYQLPFILLADPKKEVYRLYGVSNKLGILPPRKTFVIDTEGKIVQILDGLLSASLHVDGSLKALQKQSKQEQPKQEQSKEEHSKQEREVDR